MGVELLDEREKITWSVGNWKRRCWM